MEATNRNRDTIAGMIRNVRDERGGQAIEPETARRLFITDQMSISRLEGFAACPYRHFIEYGLRPVQRETFDFEASDAGTFFHAALDRYMQTAGMTPGWPDISHEDADRMMDRICDALTASGREDDRVFAKNAPSERFGETPSAGKTNA